MNNWILEDFDGTGDVKENAEGVVVQVRDHIVIVIKQHIGPNGVPAVLDLWDVRSAITFHTGQRNRTVNPTGSGKFICVRDGAKPMPEPMEILWRVQTWEYYGPWKTAPAEWNI